MADLEERLHVCLFDPRGFQALDGNSNFGRSVLGCIEADVLQLNAHFPEFFSIYQMVRLLHCSELNTLEVIALFRKMSANVLGFCTISCLFSHSNSFLFFVVDEHVFDFRRNCVKSEINIVKSQSILQKRIEISE